MRLKFLLACVLGVSLAGCYNPSVKNKGFACSDDNPFCPAGFFCVNHLCQDSPGPSGVGGVGTDMAMSENGGSGGGGQGGQGSGGQGGGGQGGGGTGGSGGMSAPPDMAKAPVDMAQAPVDMAQPPPPTCGQTNDPCTQDSDCCSGSCFLGLICD